MLCWKQCLEATLCTEVFLSTVQMLYQILTCCIQNHSWWGRKICKIIFSLCTQSHIQNHKEVAETFENVRQYLLLRTKPFHFLQNRTIHWWRLSTILIHKAYKRYGPPHCNKKLDWSSDVCQGFRVGYADFPKNTYKSGQYIWCERAHPHRRIPHPHPHSQIPLSLVRKSCFHCWYGRHGAHPWYQECSQRIEELEM